MAGALIHSPVGSAPVDRGRLFHRARPDHQRGKHRRELHQPERSLAAIAWFVEARVT